MPRMLAYIIWYKLAFQYSSHMKNARLLASILAILLIVITLPVYFTISGLSFMAFDSPDALGWSFAVVGTVIGVSLLSVVGSLVGSLLLIRRQKIGMGLGVSLIPILVLAIFWVWLSQQSFS